jgi:hypothetical protein
MLGSGGVNLQAVGGDVLIQQARHLEAGNVGAGKQTLYSITGGQAADITTIAPLSSQEALSKHYHLLCDKLNSLQKVLILETDPATKFKIEHDIQEAEAFRQ